MVPPTESDAKKNWWSSLCSQTMAHINSMGRTCHPEFRDLLTMLGKKFIQLPPPKTGEEQDQRVAQASLVSMLVQSIAHASSMSTTRPSAHIDLFTEARKLAENDLPSKQDGYRLVSGRCSAFSVTVQSICADKG